MIRIRHGIELAGGARPWSRIPVEKRDAIARLTVAGFSDAEIALHLGTTPPMIARHRATYKLPSPRRDIALNPDIQSRLIAARDCGASIKEAAALVGYDYSAVRNYVRAADIPWPEGRGSKPLATARAAFADAIRAGETPSSAARIAGIPKATATRWIKELNLDVASKLKSASINDAIRAGAGKTAAELEDETGLPASAILRRAKRLGVALRDGRRSSGQRARKSEFVN